MLHNFCKDSAPRHVRDFYLARLYRASASSSEMNPFPSQPHQQHIPNDDEYDERTQRYVTLSRTRPRGDDGRFVPRADEEPPVDKRDRKVCGWCRTTATSQWRVGPTNGSVEMGTLCNACGINYRRALAKSPGGNLNLDRLAEQMGHTRLSIQKALKRQRKLSAPPHQFKRARTTVPRPAAAYTHHSTDRFGLPRLPLTNSHSSLTMLLADDALHSQANTVQRPPPLTGGALDSPVFPVSRGPASRYLPQSVGLASSSAPLDYAASAAQHHGIGVTEQHVETVGGHGRDDDQSRLPPFQAFIGDLERHAPM